jgi:subtilisin family serine protease
LLVAALVAVSAGAAPIQSEPESRQAAGPEQLRLRRVPDKRGPAIIPPGHSRQRVHVKFQEGTAIRLRAGGFVSLNNEDLSALEAVLSRYPGTRIRRLFSRSEQQLAREKARIETGSRRQQADKNLYYRLYLRPEASAENLIDDLNALSLVEIAYPEPLPAPPPVTPDFSDDQGYLFEAPQGIDAEFASDICGGRGEAVKVIDIEYSWNQSHEDLSKAGLPGALIANKTPVDPFNDNDHGTAVLGELVADNNGFGVTGIVYNAALGMVNANNMEDGYDLADAIDLAAANLAAGDLMIIEQQTGGPNGCDPNTQFGCVAVEWVQAYYDAIVAATSDGIIVLEAAGNGSQNLGDTAVYGDPFPGGRADSGAIIVGAGRSCTAPARGRLGFSNFGPRVNLQGWGQCVTTTGYGDLQGAPNSNDAYTAFFSGTSSATPIVTGAAASLSSVAQTLAGVNLTSTQVRALLQATGTPQDTSDDAGNIGPLPNLRAVLSPYETVAPDITCPPAPTEECTSPAGGAVSFTATATDDCDPDPLVSCVPPSGSTFALGTTPVQCTAADAVGNEDTCNFNVTVVDTTPPLITCPADVSVECTGNCGISADDPQLSGFFAAVSASDVCDATPVITHDAPDFLELGTHQVTFAATDDTGNAAQCVARVSVLDTEPPSINASVSPTVLWPPNHKLVDIHATVAVSDVCDPHPTFVLTSITSNEPPDGRGDGNTAPDIQGAELGTPDVDFKLRAERQGGGAGRVYTIVYTVTDKSGNQSQATVFVRVPHNR